MISVFAGQWSDSHDVCNGFGVSPDTLKHSRVFVAFYEYEDDGGYAFVLYAKEGVLYEVHGSHCSCYGLEEQWQPEETTIEALTHWVKHGVGKKYMDGQELKVLSSVKRYLSKF